jgi:hypothetical protein
LAFASGDNGMAAHVELRHGATGIWARGNAVFGEGREQAGFSGSKAP